MGSQLSNSAHRILLIMSAGSLTAYTHPPKLQASTQVEEALISPNLQLSKALDFVSNFSNYVRECLSAIYCIILLVNMIMINYQIYNTCNFN